MDSPSRNSGNSSFSREPFTVLVSSVGRRSQLLDCFREAFDELGIQARLIGVDADPEHAPAAHQVDACFRVPRCTDPEFIPAIFRLCREQQVKLVVPTIDTELPAYAEHRQDFLAAGTAVAVSSPQTVRIARDKSETHRWLVKHGFPTLRQDTPEGVVAKPEPWQFPLIVKPVNGSASLGVQKVSSLSVLRAVTEGTRGVIVEEHARGLEHTVNVLVEGGRCLCAVPHYRMEARGGEVSKGITRKNERVMALAKDIAEALPGADGALNIQCFVSEDGNMQVTEINARFGGGFPLANHAGAKFPRWLIEPLIGRRTTAAFADWSDDVLMLRYDSAVFVPFRAGNVT
jgi:carbamoyl-phosphate synthase large subunit